MKETSIDPRKDPWRQVKFSDGQRVDLLKTGLADKQVAQLQNVLPEIKLRLERPIPSSRVKEELKKLKKALTLIEKMPEYKAGVEALSRLSIAQMWQQKDPQRIVPLQTLLTAASAANEAIDDAIAGIPKYRGKVRRSAPQLNGLGEVVAMIIQALRTGHADHYRGLAAKQPPPKFAIRAGRHNETFTLIVGIVRDATGRWSVDEAIRAYRKNLKKIESR